MRKRIAILGSTGSIGTQALEVISNFHEKFEVEVLTAFNNVQLLIEQAITFQPNAVVIANERLYTVLADALKNHPIKVYAGNDALEQIVQMDSIDIVLAAMVGYSGLMPVINAIKARKTIALANKETLVVAGEMITRLARENNTWIIPVDSEHSAIFQCLVGEPDAVEKIYLTASGGPFRGKDRNYLDKVTKKEALRHPNWTMGAKITIDSATLMNKGLEVIEARWLFNLQPSQIEVVIHPQSILHSFVQFIDGSIKAQMGLPDMKLPIQYAFSYPDRIKSDFPRFSFVNYPNLSFEPPDFETFPNLTLAYYAMKKGGTMPCVLNASNEIAVGAFLNDMIGFYDISRIIEKTMEKVSHNGTPALSDYQDADREARIFAESLLTS
ncbi:MAG: 1-deoxy-D-xylulose-5-phosphate reductoisomerase [Bacteroidales bacterium]